MINRTVAALIIAAAILMTGMSPEPAAGGQTAATEQVSAVSSERTFEGLLAVKEADGVFLVRAEDGTKKRFTLSADTVITRNGKPATYKDLRSRDRLRVHYDSNFHVTEIQAEGS